MPKWSQLWSAIVDRTTSFVSWADQHDGFFSFLALLLSVLAVILWRPLRRRWRSRRKAPTLPPDTHDRQVLLRKVRAHWVEAQRKDNLREQVRIDLRLTELPQAMQSPVTIVATRDSDVPSERFFRGRLLDFFENHSGNQLLILGEPGTGKTTLLSELAEQLIETAESDPKRQIPVVFNLSSWGHNPAPLGDWMQSELFVSYGISRQRARQWVVEDCILPLLDGLDEVAEKKRADCAAAINEFREKRGLHPMAVCCRTKEYAATAHLNLGGALRVEKLTPAIVDAILSWPEMAKARELIAADPSLRDVLDTPLTLNVLYLAARDGTGATAQGLTPGERLFERYVQSMLRRSLKAEVEQAKVREQLEWLAAQMRTGRITLISLEDLDFEWLPTRRARRTAVWCTQMFVGQVLGQVAGLIIGLLIGQIPGLVGGLLFRQVAGQVGVKADGVVFILVFSLVFGPVFGLVSWLLNETVFAQAHRLGSRLFGRRVGRWFRGGFEPASLEPVDRLSFVSEGLLGYLFYGLVVGLIIGLCVGLYFGLVVWLIVGLVVGLVSAFGRAMQSASVRERSTPNEGTWRSAFNALYVGGAGLALFGGAVLVVLSAPAGTAVRDVALAVAAATSSVLVLSLPKGGAFALRHLAIRLVLSWTTPAPLRLVNFLHHASHNLLLRQRGGAFEFAHLTLRDYLAAQWDRRTSSR